MQKFKRDAAPCRELLHGFKPNHRASLQAQSESSDELSEAGPNPNLSGIHQY